MGRIRNVFDAIEHYGSDLGFAPQANQEFEPCEAPAGSWDRIETLRQRLASGLPLWHQDDRADYSGLTGAIRPRGTKGMD